MHESEELIEKSLDAPDLTSNLHEYFIIFIVIDATCHWITETMIPLLEGGKILIGRENRVLRSQGVA